MRKKKHRIVLELGEKTHKFLKKQADISGRDEVDVIRDAIALLRLATELPEEQDLAIVEDAKVKKRIILADEPVDDPIAS